jgi:Triose-phosphate Transporter family
LLPCSIALDRIGISLTYTSKCAIPLFTVVLSVLLDGTGSLPNALSLVSLIPIALGIAAASWNSPTFELWGFIAAIVSTTSQSALNVTSKRAIAKAGVSGPTAQRSMAAVGLLITLFANLTQVIRLSYYNGKLAELRARPPFWVTAMAVMAYHVEYSLSFAFVRLVQPITYGTCDAIRRLCIILAGRQFFGGNKMTKTNMAGIALALLGALAYSITSTLK